MKHELEPEAFLEVVRQPLGDGDAAGLAEAVREHWEPQQVCRLLSASDRDVRRVAAMTLGLIGDRACLDCLARALHDEDAQVNQMAEHGMWSIWFRLCNCQAAQPFQEGVTLLGRECYEQALACFDQASRLDPDFAEAHNQAGIAHFLSGQWEQSLASSCRALELMPMHFGAMAGMGHCYTHLGELEQALGRYRCAVRINPRMAAIHRAIQRLEHKLGHDGCGLTQPLTDGQVKPEPRFGRKLP